MIAKGRIICSIPLSIANHNQFQFYIIIFFYFYQNLGNLFFNKCGFEISNEIRWSGPKQAQKVLWWCRDSLLCCWFFFVGKKAQLFFSVTKCIQFGWCSMVEKHAPNSFAELYKKSICRLLLIELGPRVIKKPYAFLDMGWREKKTTDQDVPLHYQTKPNY